MALNKVVICGVNTAKLPVLSNDEKNNLFIQMEQGDADARIKLVEGNLRLVLSVIQRFSSSVENVDDLFQVGCIGLLKAIDNFDRSLNVRFSTYAVPMIIGECRRYLRDNNTIRVSRSLRDIAYKTIFTKEKIMREENREPTIEEIAKELELEKEMIVMALDAISTPMSLYEPIYQEGGDAIYVMDQVSDKKNREDNWIKNISLKEAMERLTKREYNIVKLRFFEGKTQTEVAEEISISQAQVSRLEKSALRSMKSYLDL